MEKDDFEIDKPLLIDDRVDNVLSLIARMEKKKKIKKKKIKT